MMKVSKSKRLICLSCILLFIVALGVIFFVCSDTPKETAKEESTIQSEEQNYSVEQVNIMLQTEDGCVDLFSNVDITEYDGEIISIIINNPTLLAYNVEQEDGVAILDGDKLNYMLTCITELYKQNPDNIYAKEIKAILEDLIVYTYCPT